MNLKKIRLFVLAVATLCLASETNYREKRSIGKWFSGMWKKFSKKEPDRRPIYHFYPSQESYGHGGYDSFGPPPQPHYDAPYAPHHPAHVTSPSHDVSSYVGYDGGQVTSFSEHGGYDDFGNSYGGSHGIGHGGGHGGHSGGHGSHGGHGGGHGEHESGYSGHGGHESGYGGHGGEGKHIPHGFGPLKNSDVIDTHISGSYVPTAPHIPASSYGAPVKTYSGPPNKGSFGGDSYGAPIETYSAPVDTYSPPKDTYGAPVETYSAPSTSYSGGDGKATLGGGKGAGGKGQKGSFVPSAPSPDSFVELSSENDLSGDGYISTVPVSSHGQSHSVGQGKGSVVAPRVPSAGFGSNAYVPPSSNSISVTDSAYKTPVHSGRLPLDSHGSGSFAPEVQYTTGTGDTFADIQNIIQTIDQASGASSSSPLRYSPNLGPDDPIIEIVFQEGDPIPAPPPPKVDPKLFLPAQDDVEVYFIEYSSEDEIKDVKNIDVNNAQPAILEDLPSEIPHDLKNQLLKSGILENAQIEILNLDNAIHNPTIDPQTRHAIQQAYTRPHRQAPSFNEVDGSNQNVDVRVHQLLHNPNTPEGFAELLSGLNGIQKGTYAGKVEVNDENSEKFIPVSVNGDRFPLPDNLPLENKKVDGVLVLAEDDDNVNTNNRDPRFSGSTLHRRVTRPAHRRNLDINWNNADNNGWIPIPNS